MAVEILRPAPESAGARRASALEGTELVSPAVSTKVPDPEVRDKAVRRRFTAKYKLSILRRADACKDPGSIGELLRQEGLYSSHLTNWRHQRDDGSLAALAPKHRGRKAATVDPVNLENERLRKENSRLEQRLKQAELIIDIQKKVSQMLGITLATPPDNDID